MKAMRISANLQYHKIEESNALGSPGMISFINLYFSWLLINIYEKIHAYTHKKKSAAYTDMYFSICMDRQHG